MKYLSYIDKQSPLNQLAVLSFLGTGLFIIFLCSPNVLGDFFSRYTKLFIFIFPWVMLCLAYSWQVIADREHRLEIILIVSIIILGIVNTFLSDSVSTSINSMRNFCN